ncbi:translocase [Pacificoceanicola onchidii]|uniref:translocase n=1 Tax=Pacificoceanicola onchidii TaxID=2562685 RepID=UPI0010A30FE1|nr:translocase [Pacificoceanicola onchidii]
MARLKSYILGGATLGCAMAIGYIMQYGFALPGGQQTSDAGAIEVTDITLTTSGLGAPRAPLTGAQPEFDGPLGSEPVRVAAAADPQASDISMAKTVTVPGGRSTTPIPPPECAISMEATTSAGAMVSLAVDAPCNANERVTIHHHGMMFTDVMAEDGSLNIAVPALTENALFIAAFSNGEGATASAEVTSLAFYDRVAVQWKGDTGLQLHAREFAADYFTTGHVWAESSGDLAAAANGEGGFLVRLGETNAPDALMAEVYTFPSGTAKKSGDILLSVEAEVTEVNCDAQVEAQTLDVRGGEALRVGDLTLEIPACDSVGDFLVLKNIVQDLKVAAR